MEAFGFQEHGDATKLSYVELPEPEPGPEEVRVRLRAAAFNHLDQWVLGGIPGVTVELPHALGSDGAGVVDRVGREVRGLSAGDRVVINPGLWDGTCDACRTGQEALCRNYRILGEHTQGTVTTYAVVPRRNVHPMPERLSFPEAAAFPLVFETAWRALKTIGEVHPGDRVAIIGAGGGVATAAVQIAKVLGARVAVASHSPAKAERIRALGADDFLPFDAASPLDRALWQWSEKKGVDVVLDSVGAPTLPRVLRSMARAGRIVVIGATAGATVELDVRTLFWRQASVRGSTMAGPSEFAEVLGHVAAGRLKPVVDSISPYHRAADAFRRLDAPDLFGKVVVELAGTP